MSEIQITMDGSKRSSNDPYDYSDNFDHVTVTAFVNSDKDYITLRCGHEKAFNIPRSEFQKLVKLLEI